MPTLAWRACHHGFQCATARVPLDYRHPYGRTITLALIRLRAADPARRIGSLFVNPGGPGGSAVAEVLTDARLFAPSVRARFDIVGMDPRGVGGSTPVRCFATSAAQERVFGVVSKAPAGRAQYRRDVRLAGVLAARCAARNGALLDHLSTANVARDMDLVRQAVGDRQLSYYGVSYGTYLGATYAAMFPGRVRALVLDGNIDPPAYRAGPMPSTPSIRAFANVGAHDTLGQFFRLCARPGRGARSRPGATRRLSSPGWWPG